MELCLFWISSNNSWEFKISGKKPLWGREKVFAVLKDRKFYYTVLPI